MTRTLRGLTLVLGIAAAAFGDDAPRGRLLFLGVAYDEAPPQGHSGDHYNYAPDNFSRLFCAQTKGLFSSVEVATLKGNQATHPQVLAALAALQHAARPEDLAFVYWGTHGGTSRKGWGANLPGGGAIYAAEIKQALAQVRCPVVCMISTCGSGGFPHDGQDGVSLPDNVIAVCACRGKQSTNNELDRAVCEALAGFGDADASGDVTLREVLDYVPLRYRKIFRGGDPTDDQLPVLAHAESAPLDRPVTQVTGEYAAVAKDGAWYGATILDRTDRGVKVRYLGYDSTTRNAGFSFPDEVVAEEYLDLPGGEAPIEVEDDGVWYPARILSREGMQLRIHYLGYPESDDATVPRSRVRFVFSDAPKARKPGGPKRKKVAECSAFGSDGEPTSQR